MEYIPLPALFYSDKNQYEIERAEIISGKDIVRLDFDISGNTVFYRPVPELFDIMLSIERTDKRVANILGTIPKIAVMHFTKRCLIDEIVLTNNIEGVYSSRREIGELVNQIEPSDKNRKKFEGLVAKYKLLEQWPSATQLPLENCHDIRSIYDELVLAEVSEEDPKNIPDGNMFRKESVSVLAETQKEIHRGVYPEDKIIELMDKALKILNNSDIDVLIRIAAFHYFFGYIHPFYDGNGRTVRFLSSYSLSRELNHIVGYRLSYVVNENLKDYYKAFRICNDPRGLGDITPFLIMFMSLIKTSIEQLEVALSERQKKLGHYKSMINSLPNGNNDKYHDLYYALIQASLFAEQGISTSELLLFSKISRVTLSKRLAFIRETGALNEIQAGKEKYYSLNLRHIDTERNTG